MTRIEPPKCPICKCYCVVEINRDVAICPFHGEIEGIVFYITKNMSALDALIEIRASQAMMEISRMAAWMMSDFDNFMRKKI